MSSSYKILIVEDEGIAALSLKESLERFGYQVCGIAADKEEALYELEQTLPDLVLMDINLQEKDEGIEIGKKILRDKAVPVVFLTAYADRETVSKAKEAFPYGYIIKPYVENDLWVVIETAIHKHLADKRQRELHLLKDKFYSIIAHDLKSPLAALTFTTRLLKRRADSLSKEELIDFIGEIHDTADNLFSFTENLLEWTRSEQGNVIVLPEVVKLPELIAEIFSLLKGKAENKHITLSENLMEERVFADRNMLRSVLLNLLQNSLKFSHPGTEVSVEARRLGASVELQVSDAGIGIPEEQLRHIFDFKRSVHRLGTQEEKGTGLGLLLCKEFVEANGGRIHVQSVEGKGTVVSFSLPAPSATQ